MLELVEVGDRSIDHYTNVAPEEQLAEVRRLAAKLRGARVLHLNATPFGGGVSELLRSTIPLLNGLGLVAHWRTIRGDERFFQVTKAMHNGLQGAALTLSDEQKLTYLTHSRSNAAAFTEDYDFVFVHDPQPAAILGEISGGSDRRAKNTGQGKTRTLELARVSGDGSGHVVLLELLG